MPYRIGPLPLETLILPLSEATETLVRLDEAIGRSPIKEGWVSRMHFHDTVAAMALEGELVHLEELVLHDSLQDVRTPTLEITRAHSILRTRRRIAAQPADWALSPNGLSTLVTRDTSNTVIPAGEATAFPEHPIDNQLKEIDAIIARSSKTLQDVGIETKAAIRQDIHAPFQAAPTEREKLDEWLSVIPDSAGLPTLLRAALLFDAWHEIDVLPRAGWIGSLFVAAYLRHDGMSEHHLPLVDYGARLIARQERQLEGRERRLVAFLKAVRLGALSGRKEHDRLISSREQLVRRLSRRRRSSYTDDFIHLAMNTPAITTGAVQTRLGLSKQGALNLISHAGLREITGRSRYRMWALA